MRLRVLVLLLPLLSFTAIAHPQRPQATFEVASVRPSGHEVGPDYNNQITYSPDSFTGRNVTLKRLIAEAWHCQLDQVVGPAWIGHNEYDITARIREGASSDQVALMLRSLLSDRFQLKEHNETRPMRVYELTVAHGGPKIHQVSSEGTTTAGAGFHFHGDMRQFADLLAIQFSIPAPQRPDAPVRASSSQIPVLDKTGLPGIYDFNVNIQPEIGTDMFAAWKRALGDQLGLAIDSRKGNVPVVIVDDAVKLPTGN